MKNVLIIFIRNPELGRVKTRLARVIGDEEALRIYRILLEKTRQMALETPAERRLFYSEQPVPGDEWPETHFQKFRQSPGDLGERMESAFRQAFESGADKAMIVGSDCPELDASICRRALEALDDADFVLGPSADGGYYLLGMKYFELALFRNIAWSTDAVLAQNLAIIEGMGKTCALLPLLTDIDEWEDWQEYLRKTASPGVKN